MLKLFFLWSIENVWKTASILIAILTILAVIILAFFKPVDGNLIFGMLIAAVFPLSPNMLGPELLTTVNKTVVTFLLPIIGVFVLSTHIEGMLLFFSWIAFIAVSILAFYAARFIYINFDELAYNQVLYKNPNLLVFDTKWKYVFNRYSHFVAASMYVIIIITFCIYQSINK